MDKIIIKKDSKVLFLGDSITDVKFNNKNRIKFKVKHIYPTQLKKQLKAYSKSVDVKIKGIASNRTYHVYDRLTKDCIALKPDVIFMLIGVNDAWEHYVPEQYPPLLRPMEPHIREVLRRIKMELPDAQVLFLLPFMIDAVKEKLPFHKILDEYREKLREITSEYGVLTLDLQEIFYKAQKTYPPETLAIDGIHPTQQGHKVIADAVMNFIELE